MSESKPNSDSEVNFSALILGFSSAALHYMGEEFPDGNDQIKKNLILAKQNIDIVALLKEKTSGNLSKDEGELLSQVLLDLQSKYLSAAK